MKILILLAICCLSFNAYSAEQCKHLSWQESTPAHIRADRAATETLDSLAEKGRIKAEAINKNEYAPLVNQRLAGEYMERFATTRIFSEHGRIIEGSRFRMAAFHGAAAKYSRAEAMTKVIRYFGDPVTSLGKKSKSKKIRALESFIRGSVEAIDQIAHGVGPQSSHYMSLEKSTKYMIEYLSSLKAETPDLPLFVFARSTSGVLMEEVNRIAPELIDGFIIMSSPVPVNPWVKRARKELLRMDREDPSFTLNPEGLEWAEKIMHHATWTPESIFGKKPTLIMTGSRDNEMSPQERAFYRIAARRDNIEYINVKNAPHDLLRTNSPEFTELELKKMTEEQIADTKYKDKDILETVKLMFNFINKVTTEFEVNGN